MAFSKAVELLQLARMASGYAGVSLNEIEAEFDCVRRTAQRMTDALVRVFPDTEDYVDAEGHKRWRVPRRRVAEFFAPTADEVGGEWGGSSSARWPSSRPTSSCSWPRPPRHSWGSW